MPSADILLSQLTALTERVELRGIVVSNRVLPIIDLDLVRGPHSPRRVACSTGFLLREEHGRVARILVETLSLAEVEEDVFKGEWQRVEGQMGLGWLARDDLEPMTPVTVRRVVICEGDEVLVSGWAAPDVSTSMTTYRDPPASDGQQRVLDGRNIKVLTSTRWEIRPLSAEELTAIAEARVVPPPSEGEVLVKAIFERRRKRRLEAVFAVLGLLLGLAWLAGTIFAGLLEGQ